MSATHPLDQELGDLWYRRDSLDHAGWERLYTIVRQALRRQRELSGLPGEHEDYVNDFFADVVMRLSAAPARFHVGGLNWIYRNYLRDCLRKENRRAEIFVSENSGQDDTAPEHPAAPDAESTSAQDQGSVDLIEAGWPREKLEQSARVWLSRAEDWVPVFLGLHFCADAEISETLQKLAKRLGVKSYAYKAKALGFNWDMKKATSSGEKFSATLLGRWLTRDLGLDVSPENKDAIHAAFKILCLEALNRVEE